MLACTVRNGFYYRTLSPGASCVSSAVRFQTFSRKTVFRFFKKADAVVLPGELLFREVQRFRDTWLWPALLIPAVLASLYVIWVLIDVFVLSDSKASMGKDALALGIAFYILKGFGSLIAILYAARLEVEVRTVGLFVRVAPFQRKFRHVPADELRSAEVHSAELRPRRGWRVYAVRGGRGIELVTTSGHRFLIGTQQPEALTAALAATV